MTEAKAEDGSQSTNTFFNQGKPVVLHTAVVTLQKPNSSRFTKANVLFISGSTKTFVSAYLKARLQLDSENPEMLSLNTFMCDAPINVPTSSVEFDLVLNDGSKMHMNANVLNKLTGKIQLASINQKDNGVIKKLPKSAIASETNSDNTQFIPDILIGQEYFWKIFYLLGAKLPDSLQAGQPLPSGLMLIPTKIGLVIGGECTNSHHIQQQSFTVLNSIHSYPVQNAPNLEKSFESMWKLDLISSTDNPTSVDDQVALDHFNNTVKFGNTRYAVKWPYKEGQDQHLPDNFDLAQGRFRTLSRKFSRDNELLNKCDEVIQDQLSKGIIEKVEPYNKAVKASKSPLHYLPHHHVVTPQKTTTKVRIVYDAPSKANAGLISLNECIHRGPVLLPNLCGLLLRFRKNPVVYVADVEKAFLQISIQEQDRDITRFLWFKCPQTPKIENNI